MLTGSTDLTGQKISKGVRFSPTAEAGERELFLLIASRALGVNRGELLCYLAFNAGDGGFFR